MKFKSLPIGIDEFENKITSPKLENMLTDGLVIFLLVPYAIAASFTILFC